MLIVGIINIIVALLLVAAVVISARALVDGDEG